MIRRSVAPVLAVALTTAVLAQDVQIGGPLQPGRGRPPLHVNANPATSVYYNPTQIRHAYGFDQLQAAGINGTGQKIGIVDAYGNPDIQSDLNTFCSQFGLTASTVTILGRTSRNTGWGLETALDVEWSHVVAPNATIILSVANSSSLSDLLAAVNAAVQAGATVVSMSWGSSEFSGENSYDTYFNQPGVTFVASSGDSGAGVEWPAASASVIGVGGTSLYVDANGNTTSPQVAWSGSGGGLSAYLATPSYQDGWFQSSWAARRGVPDVSYVADPNTGVEVYDAQYGGWFAVGGTSVGAPQWAALIALGNQQRGAAGTLSSPNANIYSLANATPTTTPYSVNAANFFDVTSGSDGSGSTDSAGPGYDLVTGLGTPVANNLVPSLAQPAFSLSVTPGSQTVAPNGTATYTVTVASFGGFAGSVALSIGGLPSGAITQFSPTSVNVSGTSTPVTSTLTVSGVNAGNYSLTITGTSGSQSQVATATLVVAAPSFSISASPSSETVRPGNSTTYSTTVSGSGGFTDTVKFSASGLPTGAGAAFSPASVNGSGSSTMTVTTQSTTPTGSFSLTITGTDQSTSTSHNITVTLTVSNKHHF